MQNEIEKIPGVNELFWLSHSGIVSLVREKGLEPSRPKALAPKASVSTNSTTRAHLLHASVSTIIYRKATTHA